jgi:putative spermidine/putrescine transport system permease protein
VPAALDDRIAPRLARWLLGAVMAAAFLAPLAYLLIASASSRWAPPALLPQELSLARWADVLARRPDLAHSLVLSVLLSLAVACFSTACGFVTSRRVARSRHRGLLIVLAYAPFAVSPVILGACLLYFFIQLGISGTVLGVFAAQIPLAFGFSVVFFLGLWTPRMTELENLVLTLGGSWTDVFFRALVPVCRGMLLICFFQTFLISWVQYGVTLVVGQGKVKTLPIKVYDFVYEANVHDAAVVGIILVVPPLVLLWFNRRFLFKVI